MCGELGNNSFESTLEPVEILLPEEQKLIQIVAGHSFTIGVCIPLHGEKESEKNNEKRKSRVIDAVCFSDEEDNGPTQTVGYGQSMELTERTDAERQKAEILRSAAETREKIIAEARARAEEQGERIIAAAKANAETEREVILRDARHQVALLSIAISEKILRGKLEDEQSQTSLAEKLLEEMGNDRDKNRKEA